MKKCRVHSPNAPIRGVIRDPALRSFESDGICYARCAVLPAVNALTPRVIREIFLADVFLWKTPLDCAFWISRIAFSRAFLAPSASFLSMAVITVLIEDFTVVLM